MSTSTVWLPPEYRKPIEELNAKEIFEELVEDAVRLHTTPLERFVKGCEKIGAAWKVGAEGAYSRIREEKYQRTGSRMMPMA